MNAKTVLPLPRYLIIFNQLIVKILQWLGNEAPVVVLRDEVIKLVQVLSTPDIGAKHLASLCLQVLKDKPTPNIEQLLLKLIRNEELAHYIAVDMQGTQYLFKQISQIPVLPTLPKSGISATIISNMATKATAPSSQKNSHKKAEQPSESQKGQLENLNPVCKILETDNSLARLIRESGTSTSSHIWSHTFKKDPPEVDCAITIRVSVLFHWE